MKKNQLISQILFFSVLLFIIVQSIKIKRLIFILNWNELIAFILPMILVVPIFLLILKFLVPELITLYQIKNKYDKSFIKNGYFILIFYLISTVLLHLLLKNIIESFTTLSTINKSLPLVYAHIVTPFLILLIRKFGNKEFFEKIMYGEIILILFVLMIKIPIGGIALIYNEFLWIITGVIFPTMVFAIIDMLTPSSYKFKK
ncbi:MAG: hypothetical protein KAU20_04635 [Nanoarchaeota archaeon]|nr:hypothetical protein [Nanoarchaeota archaeon]